MSDKEIKLEIEDVYNIKFDIAKKCFRLANKLGLCLTTTGSSIRTIGFVGQPETVNRAVAINT